ncbi:MAG: serine/threonine-protein kinase [Candidatus Bilamarchaeum sp.]
MNDFKRLESPIGRKSYQGKGEKPNGYIVLNGHHYRLGRQVGEGTQARVFRVVNRPLVAKINDDNEGESALREGKTLERMSSTGVVRCFEHGKTPEGRSALILEFIRGTPFSEAIHRIGPARALRAVRRLGVTMEEVHAHGVIHRDLKPANVMLTDDRAKVLDFGISARAGHHDDFFDRTTSGTPRYMAPEQFSIGLENVGFGLDTYALGVIITEALTGQAPFSTNSMAALVYEKMCGIAARNAAALISKSPRTQQIPDREGIAELAGRMLSPFPDDRPKMDEVNKTLGATS